MSANSSTDTGNIRDMLLDAAGLSLDRLPMLHVIFDRMSAMWVDNIRHLAASPAYCSLSTIESGRIGDILEIYESNAIAGLYNATNWDTQILVGFDRDFIFTMIEVLLGSDGTEPPIDDERSFSNIEIRMAHVLFEHVSKALKSAFSFVSNTSFKLERHETRMDFAVIGRRNNLCVVAKFLMQALNRGGEMFVLIPQSALTPMRQSLTRIISSDPTVRDPRWSKQIESEVRRAEVTLRAVLEKRSMTLEEISNLKVGQTIHLQANQRSLVTLESAQEPLFRCHLGKAEGVYTLRVEEPVDEQKEFYDGIMGEA